MKGHELIENLVNELCYLMQVVQETNADASDDTSELYQILVDADNDTDLYFDYADSIIALLEDLEIKD